MYWNRTNVPTSLGQLNPNTTATRNRTRRLAQHQAATWTHTDWNSVCPQRNPGVRTTPGWTPGIVRTLCRPFRAFMWFPIHKPLSNFTIPVACITKPATDSRFWATIFWRFFGPSKTSSKWKSPKSRLHKTTIQIRPFTIDNLIRYR